MNELEVFRFEEGREVRTLERDGEPWFVAKDVCDILGHSNSRMALEMLDDDEKGVSKVYTLGGEQEMNIINESGLYNLIYRSNKPEAKRFRKWVTSEVTYLRNWHIRRRRPWAKCNQVQPKIWLGNSIQERFEGELI